MPRAESRQIDFSKRLSRAILRESSSCEKGRKGKRKRKRDRKRDDGVYLPILKFDVGQGNLEIDITISRDRQEPSGSLRFRRDACRRTMCSSAISLRDLPTANLCTETECAIRSVGLTDPLVIRFIVIPEFLTLLCRSIWISTTFHSVLRVCARSC